MKARGLALIGLYVAGLLLATWAWMDHNGFFARPPCGDTAAFRFNVYVLAEALRTGGVWHWFSLALTAPGDKPPLLFMLGSLAAAILDPPTVASPRALWFASACILVLFLFATFRFARRTLPFPTAILAVAITATTPVVITYTRLFWHQMLLTALVLLALSALLDSRGFRRRGPSVACGLFMLLACLTKILAPIYIGGAYLAALIIGSRSPGLPRRTVLLNAALAVAIPAISLWWYLPRFAATLAYATVVVDEQGQSTFSSGWSTFAPARWIYYPIELVNNGFGFFLALAVAAAVLLSLLDRRTPADTRADSPLHAGVIVLATSVVAFVALTIGQAGAHCQYVMWLVPLGCTLLAREIRRGPRSRRMVLGLLTLCAAIASVVLSFRSIEEDRALVTLGPIQIVGQMDVFAAEFARAEGCVARKAAEDWPVAAFADLIAAGCKADDLFAPVVRCETRGCFDRLNLYYELARRGVRIVYPLWEDYSAQNPFRVLQRCTGRIRDEDAEFSALASTDFLVRITKDGHPPADEVGAHLSLDAAFPRQAPTEVDAEILATRTVTTNRHLQLIRIRPTWRGSAASSRDSGDALWARSPAGFSNGWTLLHARVEEAGRGMVSVRTRWSMRSPGADVGVVVVRVAGAAAGELVMAPGVPLRQTPTSLDPRGAEQVSASWCLPVAGLMRPLSFQVGMFTVPRNGETSPVEVASSEAPVVDRKWVTAVVEP